ncbi:MAG: tetratricopeptide repeat protein [Bacteroidota bacterium]
MAEKSDNPLNFWQELKRRKVVRVITVYAAAAFVILELVDIVSPALRLPSWTMGFVIVLLCIGFIISTILSWVYDITPTGVQKTKPIKKDQKLVKSGTSNVWKIATYVSFVVIIGLLLFNIIANIKKSSDISRLEKTIAVLPFENFSPDENNSHLGDAIANEISTQLVKIKKFQVRSFTSCLQYKRSDKPSMPQIGSELNANFIIEGTLELQDKEVTVHVQVIQAENDNHIWAEAYRGEWSEIHTIRANIAKDVANELKVLLSNEEIEQIEKKPTENLEAYEYYLRGNEYYWRSYEEQDYTIAINMYQNAIDLDPNFALAYSMVAKCHLALYWFHHDRSIERLKKGKRAIDEAFRIEPNLPEAYISSGYYYYWGLLDYTEALKQLEIALEYLPNNTECHYLMACVYRRMGEWENAEEEFITAANNDPRNTRIVANTAEIFFLLGDYSKSLYYYNLATSLSPEFSSPYWNNILMILKCEGKTNNARQTLDQALLFINPLSDARLIHASVLLDIIEGKYQSALDFLNTTNFEAVGEQFFYHPKPLLYAIVYDLMNDKVNAEQFYSLSRKVLEAKINDFPDDSRLYSALGICYAGLGLKKEAIEAGEYAVELLPISKEAFRGMYRLVELARIYVMVGEFEIALEKLDYLLSIPGTLSAKLLQLDPIWKPMWNLPEFQELIAKYSGN